MNIGSLYRVKKWSWLLFPTKETVAREVIIGLDECLAAQGASYWSKQLNCDVTYFPLGSIVVFLEEDGKLKKVLTSDGKIGWIWFTENYNDSFEEMKTES